MTTLGQDSLNTRRRLVINQRSYDYFSLAAAEQLADLDRLPLSLKVLLENLLRHEDGETVTVTDMQTLVNCGLTGQPGPAIHYRPARVTLDELNGTAALVDLAAMREALAASGHLAERVKPALPVSILLNHPPQQEQHRLLDRCQRTFANLQLVTTSTQPVQGVCTAPQPAMLAYPDSCIGQHSAVGNAFGCLGWETGSLQAAAAMLGQPLAIEVPEVVGVELSGLLPAHCSAADLARTLADQLQQIGVNGRFVEFCGHGLEQLATTTRIHLARAAAEQGAYCGFFPVDSETLRGLQQNGHDAQRLLLVEQYAKAQGLWRDADQPTPLFSQRLLLDLSQIESSVHQQRQPTDCGTPGHSINVPTGQSAASPLQPSAPFHEPISETDGQPIEDARILALLGNPPGNRPLSPAEGAVGDCPRVILAGRGYGSAPGLTARDIRQLGVKAVIAESFDDRHRAELANAGVLPLEFLYGDSWQALELQGDERLTIDLPKDPMPQQDLVMTIQRNNGRRELVELLLRLDSADEIRDYLHGGTLRYLLKQLQASADG